MSDEMKHKVWKSEKSIFRFHAHENPRIWPDNKIKRYWNVAKYDEKPIKSLKTMSVMEKKKVPDYRKILTKILKISTLFNLIRI